VERVGGLPGSLDGLGPVHVAQLAQAEAVPAGRVHVSVHRHRGAGGRHLERLAHLHVHLKVGDGAPVVRGWGRGKCIYLFIFIVFILINKGLCTLINISLSTSM